MSVSRVRICASTIQRGCSMYTPSAVIRRESSRALTTISDLLMVWVGAGSFFFQAEDGIRDHCVTGVQTCALPICSDPGDRDRGIRTGDRGDRNRMGDPAGRGELTSFGQFLGGHSAVAEQLSKDPSLANNKEYLANHPELGQYLKAHPAMTQQLSENPQAVMSSNWVMQGNSTTGKTSPPKGKPSPNQ